MTELRDRGGGGGVEDVTIKGGFSVTGGSIFQGGVRTLDDTMKLLKRMENQYKLAETPSNRIEMGRNSSQTSTNK